MKIENIPIDSLLPADYNPRKDLKPGDAEYEKLVASLNTYGNVQPLVVNTRGGEMRVVGGHQRLKVLKARGDETVPCVLVDYDEATERACNIALNKIGGDWDKQGLAKLLNELDGMEYDLELTGFDADELDKLLGNAEEQEKVKPEYEFGPELMESHNYVVLYFDNDIDWQTAQETFDIHQVTDRMHGEKLGGGPHGLGVILPGAEWIRRLQG